ncbi:Kynurenine formamidase [Physocladia obscura]|uniref:Kynurenine formamidase n=1 Tax=Physocladia obscura TaxID=109957 RepID=A0AAD5TB11_9FUNG|nr:Kynurenine formamidase [Physocladia obscura]
MQEILSVQYAGAGDTQNTPPEQTSAFNILDLYTPDPLVLTCDTPFLIFIHGGAWRAGKPSDYRNLAHQFVGRGFGVAAVGYRLSTKTSSQETAPISHPAHVIDVAAGVAWLIAHCIEPGKVVDSKGAGKVMRLWNPKNWFIAGHSAGAQLGSLLSLNSNYIQKSLANLLQNSAEPSLSTWRDRFRGYIGVEGIYDIPLLVATYPSYRDWFISNAFGKEGDARWIDGSPVLTQLVDTDFSASHLVIFSKNDGLVDIAQSQRWVDRLKKIAKNDVAKINGTSDTKWTVDEEFDSILSNHDDVLADPLFFEIVKNWIKRKAI